MCAGKERNLTSWYSQGTSAQVVQDGSQKLYFNKSGEKASFIGQRLTDNRKERGVATEGEMTKEEKQQVPSHVYQHDTRHTAHGTRHTAHDTRHTTHDTRHTTHDTGHTTHDTGHRTQ